VENQKAIERGGSKISKKREEENIALGTEIAPLGELF